MTRGPFTGYSYANFRSCIYPQGLTINLVCLFSAVHAFVQSDQLRAFQEIDPLGFCVNMPSTNTLFAVSAAVGCALAQRVPAAAQIVDQRTFNVLETVPPPAVANDSTVHYPINPLRFAEGPDLCTAIRVARCHSRVLAR